jgi:hypothetical protein
MLVPILLAMVVLVAVVFIPLVVAAVQRAVLELLDKALRVVMALTTTLVAVVALALSE